MEITSEEWGGLREDVGYIKAKVSKVDDLDRRVALLENTRAGSEAVRDEQEGRRNLRLRAKANMISLASAATAVVAVLVGSHRL